MIEKDLELFHYKCITAARQHVDGALFIFIFCPSNSLSPSLCSSIMVLFFNERYPALLMWMHEVGHACANPPVKHSTACGGTLFH